MSPIQRQQTVARVQALEVGQARQRVSRPTFTIVHNHQQQRVGLGVCPLHAEAVIDLQRGLLSDPRDWVRGRIHGQLGEPALAAGKRTHARHEFEMALDFSERGGDRVAAKEARQKLSAIKR